VNDGGGASGDGHQNGGVGYLGTLWGVRVTVGGVVTLAVVVGAVVCGLLVWWVTTLIVFPLYPRRISSSSSSYSSTTTVAAVLAQVKLVEKKKSRRAGGGQTCRQTREFKKAVFFNCLLPSFYIHVYCVVICLFSFRR
jgi:hypothetical protein